MTKEQEKSTTKKSSKVKASRKTAKAVKYFKGNEPLDDLFIKSKIDKKRMPSPYYHSKLNDKFFDWTDEAPIGKWFMLSLETLLVVAIAYWMIKQ